MVVALKSSVTIILQDHFYFFTASMIWLPVWYFLFPQHCLRSYQNANCPSMNYKVYHGLYILQDLTQCILETHWFHQLSSVFFKTLHTFCPQHLNTMCSSISIIAESLAEAHSAPDVNSYADWGMLLHFEVFLSELCFLQTNLSGLSLESLFQN